jgi:hypothetical protein
VTVLIIALVILNLLGLLGLHSVIVKVEDLELAHRASLLTTKPLLDAFFHEEVLEVAR